MATMTTTAITATIATITTAGWNLLNEICSIESRKIH